MTKRYADARASVTRAATGLVSALGLAATLLLGGCGADAICGGGDYPVQQIGGTGRQCVASKQDPPSGFVRYPSGKTPKHVDDQWDVYWRSHTLDEKGNIADAK